MLSRATYKFCHRVLIGISLLISCANAQSIGFWNFNGNVNGVAGTFNTVSTADFPFTVPARAFNAGTEYYGQDGWPAAALDPSMYLSFTLTPNAGYALNILSIELRMRHSNTGSSGGSGPTRFTLRSSMDGYATDLGSGTLTGAYANFVINPGSTFNNLPTAITFRVYGHNAVMYTGGNNRLVFDNIRVDAIGLILPAKLVAFDADAHDRYVALRYHVKDLPAGSIVVVERSVDNVRFDPIKRDTIPGFELSRTYTLNDVPPPAESVCFYRVKIVSTTDTHFYSQVARVSMAKNTRLTTVTVNRGKLRLTDLFGGPSVVGMYDVNGKMVMFKPLDPTNTNYNLELNLPSLTGGIYYVILRGHGRSRSFTVFID